MSEKLFAIRVGGTSELDCRCSMRNVSCRVSIISLKTGELLTKSSPERKVLSFYESTDVKYISPVTTKFIDSIKLPSPVFTWNEEFQYNELFSHISQKGILFLFEIIDYTLYDGHKNFIPLTWGYLKLQNKEGRLVNINEQKNIQLYEYPANFPLFPTTTAPATLKLLNDRKPIKCVLSVCVRELIPDDHSVLNERPMTPFQEEMGKRPFQELLNNDDEESLSVELDSDESIRGISARCLVPRHLRTQIYPGDHGALCLSFSHDGTLLAAGLQKDRNFFIDIFSTSTFKVIDSIPAHIDTIYELQFSNDDSQLLSASGDGTVKIWNVEKPHKPIVLPHAKFIYSAKFHPVDNKYVFTAGYDGIIRVWDLEANKNIKELRGHKTRVNSIVFAPNGRRLFAGDANGTISVWRTVIEDGELKLSSKKILHDDEIGNTAVVHLEMVRSNLSLLVHTHDDMIRVFDTKAMTTAQRYVGAKCSRYLIDSTFSPDGAYVISGSEDGNVLLWTVRMAKSAHVLQWSHKFSAPVTSVCWNPTMNMVAFSSFADKQPILIFIDKTEPKFDVSVYEEELTLTSDESDQY